VAKTAGVPPLVVGALLVTASPAFAFVTPLSSAAFTTDSEPASWTTPAVGSNGACLTAGPSTTQSSIPDCNPTIDSAGSGALRLTTNANDLVGSVFYSVSLPTSQGLDVSFNTYQYDGSGADGISFGLAATNPADPTAPASAGALGGALGYSTNGSTAGVPYGYLGLALDVYGNFENSAYGGSSCTVPSGLTAGTAYPESVTARGPGDGTTGYCILGTTASTYQHGNGGGSGGDTISNLGTTQGSGGYYLDKQSATSRSGLAVPVEIVINPSASAATAQTSLLSVPAHSWFIAYEPLGASSWQSISGALPTTSNNTVLANDFPSGWIDPTTGIPYQLTFGWTSSTGGSTEIHEVTGLGAQSLNGPIPVLAVGNVDNESSEFLAGNQAIYTLSPSVALDAGNGGSESSELTLTDTFPTGITPGTASAPSDWSCLTASQVVTCTYTPSAAIAAGTSLPNVTIPVTVSSGASGPLSAVARLSSIDGDPATATDTATVTSLTASPSPAATSYGNAVSLAAAGIPAAATGTVTFSSALTTLCSVNLPTLSCSTSSSLSPATYPVTATYSGDANYNGATANTSFTIDKSSAYSMTASANPSSTNYGNSVSLSVAGLPGGATGTVSFKSAATSLCSVILPALSCNTSATLGAAAYPVTATYSGDANYNGATAGTSFTITKASTAMTASANPSSTTYANSVSVSVAGLPAGATGTITFKSGTTTLCTATMPALSCNTSAMLDAATYPVTATYSGDANYSGTTAATSFAITKSSAYSMTAAANPSSTNYGNSVSLSVSGLPSAATGTVTFESGTTTLCATSLPALSCNTSATLGAASYPVTATYSGDANYNGATAGTSFTINKTSTAMTAAANPSSTTYSNSVSLSDSGLPSDATGTVTFVSGTQTLCSVSLPALSCNTSSSLSPAIYPVTATYSGDANYNGSTASTSFTINKALTAMTASANPTSTTYGNSVSLSVSGLAPGATGTVTFKSGTTTLCSASLPTSSCNTSSSLSPATYPVTATYSGDANYAGATASTSFAINKSSGYSMTASANPSSTSYGNSVSLSVSGLPVGATGTVTFSSGTTTICSASLPTLSCNTSTVLGAATYPVTATYSGDANYIGATASTSFSVNKFAGYSMSASAAPSSTPHGNSVALLASGLPAQATGSVSFTSGTTTLCSASVLSGAASCPTQSTLAAGSYPVTATYSGDANFVGSSAGTSFTISKSSGYSMTAAANPGSTSYGNSVSLTASGLPGDATGTVSFTSGTTTLCSASLPALSCNTSPTLSAARYPVTASYSGDANYNGATASTSFAITKSSAYSMTASASPGSASYGNSVSVSAAGLPADATGTITFASGTELLCTASLPALSCNTSAVLGAAAYPVTATYSGDANYNGASASTSFVITTSSTYAMTASANPGSTSYGHRVVLSVSGLPGDATGTVMFNSGTTWLCTASLPTLSCDSAATLGAAKYNVIATYSGDANYEGSQAETSFAITKSSGFSMTAAADPASTPYGNAVLLSVAGLPGDATGTVRFSSGTTTLCSASLPALSCDTSAKLDVDSYGVTASYSGNANYVGASAGTGFTVTRLDFTMSASTSDPTTYDHPVVLYVSGVPADATGQVTFRSGTTILCEASLPARSCDTSASLAVGAYGVTATYSGDPRYAGTSAVTSFSIAKVLVDTMTASATPSLARFGATVTLSAKGLPVRATGAVAFKWRSVVLCSSAVSRGGASCSPAKSLEVRRYGVVATYGGDKDDAPAEAKTSFTLIRLLSVMRAKASPATAPFGHHVELWAIGLSSRASGSIKFTEAGVLLCTATLPSVSCEAPSNLASNHYAVTASYSGSSDFSAATAHTAFSVRARVAASDVTLYTSVGRPVSTGLPVPFGTGPFSLELVGRSIQPDGTCTMTRSGRFRFVPAPRFVGTASCSYVVHSPDGATSAPASVKIFVTSAGSAIPPAHTGEPWAGSLYWRLVGMIALGGAALIMLGFRRRRGLRRV
jgi:hypothetical protein